MQILLWYFEQSFCNFNSKRERETERERGRSVTSLLNSFLRLWEWDYSCYLESMDVFLLFLNGTVQGKRTVISVTVNTVMLLTTFLIPMTCFSTFGTGKLSLMGHSVVSVFLAFNTPERIWNVDINFHPKEPDWYWSRKDRVSKHQADTAGIYSVTITLNSYLPSHLLCPLLTSFPVFPLRLCQ